MGWGLNIFTEIIERQFISVIKLNFSILDVRFEFYNFLENVPKANLSLAK